MRSELEWRRKLTANFGPARCGISSVGRIRFGLPVTSRKSIYAKDSTVILIGFVHKAMCAITSAKLLKICATKASFIASGYHDREEIILSAPKKQGLRVYVLDHCDKKALIENIGGMK